METLTAPGIRGRPREFCVDEALSAALQVFWRRGYEGASLTELTEAMGITRPSLYAAFGNKEALFRKALDLYEREKLAYMTTALEAPTAREVVERLLYGVLAMQTSSARTRPRRWIAWLPPPAPVPWFLVALAICAQVGPSGRHLAIVR